MVGIHELINRIRFWRNVDRIGPDIPCTHWKLYFKSTMRQLCEQKFQKFGERAEFRPGAYADACSKISIGNDVVIRPGTYLFADPTEGGGSICIEDKVLLGSGIHFYTNNHRFADRTVPIFDQGYPMPKLSDSITLRRGCWVGAGAIILPGVEIGENAVVGAGAVVTKSVPSGSVCVGNPGRLLNKSH